jgi:uracil phosphoribosyltransferase
MLRQADEAVIVVGSAATRSKTMEEESLLAMADGMRAEQLLLETEVPRLDTDLLPLHDPKDFASRFFASIKVYDATDKPGAKILASATRNSVNKGPSLCQAHAVAGAYLAIEYVADILGIETYAMDHVQGQKTSGHQLKQESSVLIVALMRGGEPFARGIWSIFPIAEFKHAHVPADISPDDLRRCSAIVLADFVIHSGASIIDFIGHIRSEARDIPILVAAGVTQAKAVHRMSKAGRRFGSFDVVTLRRSDNSYVGSGGTDTGNRLFNTTHLKRKIGTVGEKQ